MSWDAYAGKMTGWMLPPSTEDSSIDVWAAQVAEEIAKSLGRNDKKLVDDRDLMTEFATIITSFVK